MFIALSIFCNILVLIVGQVNNNGPVTFPSYKCDENTVVGAIPTSIYCRDHCPLLVNVPCSSTETAMACTCIKGYVLDFNTMLCIDKRYCPAPGDENARYTDCDAARQVTCRNSRPNTTNTACVPGYTCNSGFIRNSNNKCVRPNQC